MIKLLLCIFFLLLLFFGCGRQSAKESSFKINEHYFKKEYRIPMRDGKKLSTAVYFPKDTSRVYPILLLRTPYRAAPYGPDTLKKHLGPADVFA